MSSLMEDGEVKSPGLQRRKRPLSMVLEENQDEENPTSDKQPDSANTSFQSKPEETPSPKLSTDSSEKDASTAKRTRRIGVSQQHPLSLPQPNEDSSTSPTHTPQLQRRLFTPPSQRKLSENTLKLRRKVSENGELTDSESEGDSFVTRLKDTATKLNLKTRRQSYLTWRAKYVDQAGDLAEVKVVNDVDGRLTKERKEKVDNDLRWIREQLVDLRRQDRSLARQLLGIRHELSNLRLAVSCEEHRELLEEEMEDIEDLRELSRFVDFPLEILGSSPLKQIGVTKMNLSSRRFSTC